MSAPLPISVCMISGPDADRIGRALESVRGWVSDIVVVVNDDVADGTDKIAEQYGARVFREPWKEHIAQKNSAAEKALQPWILGLDSDEEISAKLKNSIHRFFLSSKAEGPVALRMARCSLFLGHWIRHGDWYPDWQTRLWRAGSAKWGGTDPHDRLIVEGRVGTLSGDMLHYSNPSISCYVSKINYFSDLYLESRLKKRSRWLPAEATFRAFWRFFRAYVFRLGFLDGYPGFYIAASTFYSTLVRHTRLLEHKLSKKPLPPKP
ncbi:MAG: glycosyltransferase family 2 protein [Candidatus Pacebacteria bacterium]|nr:glycosyltransferase family 2 protein [Candidatus Paceibacterota bacterium]